jgi:3-phenylpropionate/cinnamic acid dioxygenase small subunit
MSDFVDSTYLRDVHEIAQILYRYAVAVDTQQLELFDDCFTAQARIELQTVGVFDREGYRRLCRENLPNLDATQHTIGNPSITVDGDAAVSRCYFVAQHVRNALAPHPCLVIGGWYDDEFSKIDGKWRITSRLGTAAWADGNPAVLGLQAVGALEWRPSRACPSWMRPPTTPKNVRKSS